MVAVVTVRFNYTHDKAVMPEPGGPGGALAPPIFGRSANPIPTGKGRLSPPITTGTPNVFHLPASLKMIRKSSKNHLNPEISNQETTFYY